MIKNAYLTPNAIEKLIRLPLFIKENEISSVNVNMQICHIQYNSAFNTSFYCLADIYHNYPNFLIKSNKAALNLNDLITIKEVSFYYDRQHSAIIFLVKSYQFIANLNFSILPYTKSYNPNEEDPLPEVPFIPPCGRYNMIEDISTDKVSLCLLIKVNRKSTLAYQKNGDHFFYFEVEDKSNERIRFVVMGNKTNPLNIPNSLYKRVKLGCYYQIQGEVAALKDNFIMMDDIPEVYLSSQALINEMPITSASVNISDEIEMKSRLTIKEILASPNYLLVNLLCQIIEVNQIEFEFENDVLHSFRRITVADATGYKIQVTLWNFFTLYQLKEKDILFLETVQINPSHRTRILTTSFESKMFINPEAQVAYSLKHFLDNNRDIRLKSSFSVIDYYSECCVTDLKEIGRGISEIREKVKIKGVIIDISMSKSNVYEGCPVRSCKSRLNVRGMEWNCQKCNKTVTSPNFYYYLQVTIQDCSGSSTAILLNRCANKVLGIDAYQYREYLKSAKTILTDIISSSKYREMYFHIEKPSLNPIEIFHIEGINIPLETRALLHKVKALQSKEFLL